MSEIKAPQGKPSLSTPVTTPRAPLPTATAPSASSVPSPKTTPPWSPKAMAAAAAAPTPAGAKVHAEASARVDLFLARGDAARSLSGTTLTNEIGAALHLPPNNEPTTAAEQQRLEVGDWPFYKGKADEHIATIAASVREVAGGKDPVALAVLPLVYTDLSGKSVQVPLFRVDGPDGKTKGFVDTQGRHYSDLSKWKSENKLPPGQVSYPTDGHLKAGPDGKAVMTTEATHGTIDTPLEHLVDWAEKAGMVGGFVVGGAALIGVGGVVMPVVGTVLALGFGAKAALGLVDSERHGETLNPLKSGEARNNWLTAGASVLGLGGAAAAARAAGEVATLGETTSLFAKSAGALTVASDVAGGAQTVDGAVQLAAGWNEMSVKDRMLAASQIAFYAASTGKQLAGKSAYSMEGARAKLTNDSVMSGSPRSQRGALNLDAFVPSSPVAAAGKPVTSPTAKHTPTKANAAIFTETSSVPETTTAAPKRTTTGSFAAVSVTPTRLEGAEKALAPTVGMALKNPAGELGYLGPIGPAGPLGELGAVGKNSWNPSHYVTGLFDWSSWSNLFTAWGGPLSRFGPLGENGPLNKTTAAGTVAPLKLGGDETVLGPAGPLGALGPLGPLGPVGAHGFRQAPGGDFVDANGKIVRQIKVDWSLDRVNTEELVEHYTAARAKQLKDNDTSFMVSGSAKKVGDVDQFAFKSRTDQYVTVLVLPTEGAAIGKTPSSASPADFAKNFDNFDLTITDGTGKVLGHSNLNNGADWLQFKVPAGADLRAQVTLAGSNHDGPKGYRLVVVGTGDHTVDLASGPWAPTR